MTHTAPITMTGPNVVRIFQGLKTETRRIMQPQPIWVHGRGLWVWRHKGWYFEAGPKGTWPEDIGLGSPYVSSDLDNYLWVKESYKVAAEYDHLKPSQLPDSAAVYYPALDEAHITTLGQPFGKLRPGRFMPKKLARLWLRVKAVKDVYPQRLCSIETSAINREGIYCPACQLDPIGSRSPDCTCHRLWVDQWREIHDGPYEPQLWVWVINFEVTYDQS